MNKGIYTPIFDQGDCLREDVLLDYAHNKLVSAERNKVEKHLLDCELCSDALEGLMFVKNPGNITNLRADVVEKFGRTQNQKGKIIKLDFRTSLAIAASIAVLVVAVFFFRTSLENEKTVADKLSETLHEEETTLIQEPQEEPTKEAEADKRTSNTPLPPAPKEDVITKLSDERKKEETFITEQEETPQTVYSRDYDDRKQGAATETINSQADEVVQKTTATDKLLTPSIVMDEDKPKEKKDNKYQYTEYGAQAPAPASKTEENSKKKSNKARATSSEPASEEETQINTIAQEGYNEKSIVPGAASAGMPDSLAEEVFVIVEEMPDFPGGNDALKKYMQANLKYPAKAKEQNVQGTVYVTFIVEKDGSIHDVKALKTITGCDECSSEAVRVVKMMPNWKPGKQHNKPVKVRFNLPVKFSL